MQILVKRTPESEEEWMDETEFKALLNINIRL